MSVRASLLLLVLLPLTAFAVLAVSGTRIPMPIFGRDYVQRITLPEVASVSLPDVATPDAAGESGDVLPLVVIDAGHGGHDPGASSHGMQEKVLVLALARALRDRLVADRIARVAMTRDDDRYLVHEERFDIARRLEADLFISVHADSAGEAEEVVGASIYTLSSEASSEAAARFAERENRSDRMNGVDLGQTSDTVSDILVELSQRRTQEESSEVARLIEREGRGTLRFHPQARRSAALKVLRAPDVPSVLFESGYITNRAEAERLASAEGRRQFAEVLARAIRIYFARNSGLGAPAAPADAE